MDDHGWTDYMLSKVGVLLAAAVLATCAITVLENTAGPNQYAHLHEENTEIVAQVRAATQAHQDRRINTGPAKVMISGDTITIRQDDKTSVKPLLVNAVPITVEKEDLQVNTTPTTFQINQSLPQLQNAMSKLEEETLQWQEEEECYGCHVQAQTLVAMSLSKNRVDVGDMQPFTAMLQHDQHEQGYFLNKNHEKYLVVQTAIAGWALSHAQAFDPALNDSIDQAARWLAGKQRVDGRWETDHAGSARTPATTAYAMITLSNAQERTKDYERNITMGAEYLAGLPLSDSSHVYDVSHVIIGLQTADPEHPRIEEARQWLLEAQNPDGGWGMRKNQESDPLATGRALYALTLADTSPLSPSVTRAVEWLLEHQKPGGLWHSPTRRVDFKTTTWVAIALPLNAEPGSTDLVSPTYNLTFHAEDVTSAQLYINATHSVCSLTINNRAGEIALPDQGKTVDAAPLNLDITDYVVEGGNTIQYQVWTNNLSGGVHDAHIILHTRQDPLNRLIGDALGPSAPMGTRGDPLSPHEYQNLTDYIDELRVERATEPLEVGAYSCFYAGKRQVYHETPDGEVKEREVFFVYR